MTEYKIPSVNTTVKAELLNHLINIAIKKSTQSCRYCQFEYLFPEINQIQMNLGMIVPIQNDTMSQKQSYTGSKSTPIYTISFS